MVALLGNIALLGILAMTACGGNMRPADPVPSAFDGAWSGHVVVTIPPEIQREYDTTFKVDVSGPLALVTGVCPDGTETMAMGGFDGTLAWESSILCNPSWLLGCAVRLEYTAATATIDDDGRLHIHASGNAHRTPLTDMSCAGSVPFTMEFAGSQTAPTRSP